MLDQMRGHPELIILALMVIIIAMLVIPLPTYLIDFLIGLNMILAILVFLGSFYINRILSFSSFPSILLITTLFRLALAISTSRLILLEADAGEIINSFGQFVIGDNLAVGFVVFSIVTVVQFIVITKGSERVAEVAARFSLDGMPGKQMSIDADLRTGIIDAEAAGEKRSVLERESQLYGSFDGAMKFIKGDAIANIIIIFVNIIGGLSVGVGQHGMGFSSALSTYTILTVGDGLVSQIPALLIAISAGFIVTRVNGDSDNMGKNIMSQLLSNSFVIIVTCVLALSIGLLPGFPLPVFICLSIILGIYFYTTFWKKKEGELNGMQNKIAESSVASSLDTPSLGLINHLDYVMTETVPLVLVTSSKQATSFNDIQMPERIRSQFFVEYGIRIPSIVIRDSEGVSDTDVVLLLNEVRVCGFKTHTDLVLVVNYSEEIMATIGMIPTVEIINGQKYHWVTHEAAKKIKRLGYQIRDGMEEMYNYLSVYLSHNIAEFFGIQETKLILDQLETKYPDLLREVLRYLTVQRVSEVLQRLIQERISVRNMRLIMEALALWAPREKDIITLVEHVRGALARYICHKFAYSGELRVVVMSPEIEEIIRNGVRPTATGTFLNLEPSETEAVMEKLRSAMEEINIPMKEFIILTSVDLRRFMKKLIENHYRDLEVLSYGELTENISINVLKTV